MSIFGALNTAVSGLTAQSDAFGNISQNIANSQTVGYKEVGTNFTDLLTYSTLNQNEPGSVEATPEYENNVQGTISQSSDPLALAISGQGFFNVFEATNVGPTGQTTFNPQQFYTRNGDFTLNAQGYLVNSSGEYLAGWAVDPTTGQVNQTQLVPIQVNSQSQFNPIATSQANFSANLPPNPGSSTPLSSTVQVYDSLGNQHNLVLSWTQTAANTWQVTISSPDNTPSTTIGTATVEFGPSSGNPVPAGTIGAFGATSGNVTASAYSANAPAVLNIAANFGQGNQNIAIDLGNFGQANGVTQYVGSYSLRNFSQNGVPPGSFTNISIQTDGNVVANYSNGQSVTLAQIPITTFNDPNALQSQNGQAYTATFQSGNPSAQPAGLNGAGTLVTGSVEESNVDIATQLTKLIIAQQAYTANAKTITTADNMLQTAINMVQ